MRLNIRQLTVAAAVAILTLAVGCSADDPNFSGNGTTNNGETGVGYLAVENIVINDDTSIQLMETKASVSIDDYIIIIYKETTDSETGEVVSTIVYKDSYYNFKSAGTIELGVGNYTLKAMSTVSIPTISTQQEYASNSYDFSIGEEKVTTIEEVNCTPATVKTSTSLSADLLSQFDTSDTAQTVLSVTVTYGTASYTYTIDNAGTEIYFAPQDGVTSISIVLVGMYNVADAGEEPVYEEVTWEQEVSGVDSGQYREISITILHYTDGKIEIEVTVNSWYTDNEIGVNVTNGSFYAFVEDEIEDSEDNPLGQESETLVIDWPGYSFDTRHTIYNSDYVAAGATNPTVKFNISSDTGITGMTVKIISEVLSASELATIGLQQSLDLVNPGDTEEGLNYLGFPTGDDVKGQTSLEFDITSFMSMLADISSSGDETDFIITVVDESGYCTKTLMVVVY